MFLDHLPSATCYEKSYMHVGELAHVRVTPKTDFVVTASVDGQLKFWKKKPKEIEFVKRFYAHVGPVTDVTISPDGEWLCTIGSKDKVLNVFDVVNFDMVSMTKLDYTPSCVEWCTPKGQNKMIVSVGSRDGPEIRLYDVKSGNKAAKTTFLIHGAPVLRMRYHAKMHAVISTDAKGLIEIWDPDTQNLPASVAYKYKSDTDLYELAKSKTTAFSIDLSPDGELFACMCADKYVRIFRCLTGKLYKKIDETPAAVSAGQADEMLKLDTLDFGRRMAVEKEMDAAREKDPEVACPNCVFDQSGKLLIFPTPVGIKVMNLVENKVCSLCVYLSLCRFSLILPLSLSPHPSLPPPLHLTPKSTHARAQAFANKKSLTFISSTRRYRIDRTNVHPTSDEISIFADRTIDRQAGVEREIHGHVFVPRECCQAFRGRGRAGPDISGRVFQQKQVLPVF